MAAASGTVSELCVREGSTVRQDDVLLRITGKDLDKQAQNAADNLRSAELRMSSAERNISHYTIDAPISGTIVDKRSRPATSSAPTTPPCRTSAPSTI